MNKIHNHVQKPLSIVDGVVIIIGVFILINGLIGSGLFPLEQLADWLPGGATVINRLLVMQGLQVALMLGLTALFLFGVRHGTLEQIGLRPFAKKGWIVRSALLGVGMFFAMTLVSVLMTMLFPQWAQPQDISTVILKAENAWEWIAVIVVVSVFAPLSEEILFRGYIYHSLREKYSVIYSIIVASLLFGCMHYDLFRLLPLTLGGIALNVVSVRADSLWASIIMHGVWNFMNTLVLLLIAGLVT